MKLIEINLHRIFELCKKYRVRKLYVFGSILTDRFSEDSDVDFAVDFDKEAINRDNMDWADLFFDFLHEMESLLKRKVDMVFDGNITNSVFRKELDRTKRLVYG
ncbi:nucleotidyltransferase family protein [uncultured Muribaculum sp.]|uniref:nucleotidyltransferase family protein n=1 Tax=uncultured Muribaculum sp. TaxID=1918613 RepID=UPI0025CDD764|nr:nucleotidyltransferase domain-containing protein [uncultured Muribaculum sp.]